MARGLPLLPAVLLLATLLWPLAHPSRMLMVRDLAFFHLPLRQAVVDLLHAGEIPEWNRSIHGGQPILSNPNYAAFYPPSWLALVVPVPYALSLLILLHAAWALAGSWWLLRRLGAGRDAAALGAMGFAASSWFLSLTSSFTSFCGTAWFPWVLALGERTLAAPRQERWGRSALLTAAALALQLLAGEPVTVLVTALTLAAFALVSSPAAHLQRLRRTVPRLLAIGLLAAALGAVQLIPTLHRLAGTTRGRALSAERANVWSSPPARLVDLVLPHFWGDPMRDEEGLWFGWGLHDRDFPCIIALYSGLLLTVLTIAALLRWPIPYRGAWALAAAAGVLLALGRHNPLWEPLRHIAPLLGSVRFPERFIILTTTVVPLAGALGWQHLLERRERGENGMAFLPAALAAIVAGVAALFAILLAFRPDVGESFVRSHTPLPPSPRVLAGALAFLRHEAVGAFLLALAVAALLAMACQARVSRRALATTALALLAGDLWWYGHRLEPTLPVAQALAPPPAVARLRGSGRLFSGSAFDRRPRIGPRQGPTGFQVLLAGFERLDPYVGNLWGVEYALHPDYDLMLTSWARHALTLLEVEWPRRAPVDRLLAAWDVGALVMRRDPNDLLRALQVTRRAPVPDLVIPVQGRLPRFRFVRTVGSVGDTSGVPGALAGLDLATADLCIGGPPPGGGHFAPAELLEVFQGQQVRLHYRATGAAFLVAAMTFDDGWQARLDDGTVLETCPTSLGQIGVALPAGEHRLRLEYHDPWVRLGAAGTAVTLLAAAVATRRRRHASGPSTVESAA